VATRRASPRAQRGLALLGLLAVIVMVFAWILTSRLNAANQYVALDRGHNAKVLARAKAALIGYMAQQAATAGENNPGSLPCPEAPANFGVPAQEGITAGSCTLPAVGRLPWRTIGAEKLVDAAGEPLWYVVSPGWAMPNSTTPTLINSDSLGQLTLDGAAGSAVALIIAPGPAIAAQAGSGCAAWTQARPTGGAPDLRNYLECENANSPADASFVTARPGQAFNDQVLRVTAAEVLPALEAAIAERTQREIAPALRTMYLLDSSSPRRWVGSSSNPPMFPYAAPFGNPGTANYQGASGMYRGLLPVAPASAMVAYASTPGAAAENNSNGYIMTDPGMEQTCTWVVANDVRQCQGFYHEDDMEPWKDLQIRMTATFANVAMGLRAIDTSRMKVYAREDGTSTWTHDLPVSYQAEMNDGSVSGRPRGSVTIRFWATLPNIDDNGWDTYAEFRIRIERAVIGDHALLDTATSNPLGWFVRNQWHRLHYYRVAERNTANGLPSVGCSTSSAASSSDRCVRFNDPDAYNIRALLVQTGRSLGNPAGRPNATLTDYLEFQNCDFDGSDCDPKTLYEQRPMRRPTAVANANAPWNDRIVLLDWASSLNASQQNPVTLRLVALP
jgi:hypothetical protein